MPLTVIDRLNSLLPLQARQQQLAPALRALHRDILHAFASHGVPPTRAQVAARRGIGDAAAALQRLAQDDLIVLTPDRQQIAGAYPFTTEARDHRVLVNGHTVHAMCALDALAIAPLFNTATRIGSRCHVGGVPVEITMQGRAVRSAQPAEPWVGIHWQATGGCAAQNLCLEMVFLQSAEVAGRWRVQDPDNTSIFGLADAVGCAAAFFCPLLA